jgi:hypothetical protein
MSSSSSSSSSSDELKYSWLEGSASERDSFSVRRRFDCFDFFVVRFRLRVLGIGLGLRGFAALSSQGGGDWEASPFESKETFVVLA